MDDSAQKILRKSDGRNIASPDAPVKASRRAEPVAAPKSSDSLDPWRIHLVNLVYLFNAIFRDAHYWAGVKAEKDTFEQFVQVLADLDKLPDHDSVIQISYRGSPSAKASEKIDYVVRFGNVFLDLPAVAGIIKRMGIRVKHLEGRVTQSFKTLAAQGIKTLSIKMPGADRQSLGRLKAALQIIAGYHHAIEKETGVKFQQDGRTVSASLIAGDSGEPDPNLTILAALNNMDSAAARELVNKIIALRKNPKMAASGLKNLSVYKTIFAVKALREKLVRPPVEVNANRMSASRSSSGDNAGLAGDPDPDGKAGSDGSGGPGFGAGGCGGAAPQPIMGEAASKAEVASYVKKTYGSSPASAAQVMKSIYSTDYRQLDSRGIGSRLRTLAGMLARLDQSEKGQKVMDAIIRQIQDSFDQVSSDTLEDLSIQNGEVKLWDGETVQSVTKVDDKLAGIIRTSKSRSARKRRSQATVIWEDGFTEQDYDIIAENFGTTREHAEKICNLFQQCLDANGHFQRAAFEKQVPALAEHPNKVFEILWGFLKITSRRDDRLPFLNSFQLLNSEIRQPIKIVRFLLADFSDDPDVIAYPDRNAMMLATQCLRTYNKECHMDIELTPEEVLLAKAGLDRKVANYTAWKVDGSRKEIVAKIVTIRKALIEALETGHRMAEDMDYHYLLALEREVHILLALCGGKTATQLIRNSLSIYGEPDSEIYKISGILPHAGTFVQHLSVLIRSIARLGGPEDIAVLRGIKNHQRSFIQLDDNPRHRAIVRRVMSLVQPAVREIEFRNPAPQKADADPSGIQFDIPE